MALVTWFLILYAAVVVSNIIMSWLGITVLSMLLEGILLALVALCITSHYRAMTTDPGAVPPGAEPLADAGHVARAEYWCRKCESYKPPRSHHDSCTGRCVSRMDHFCPWVNNCVGVLNHKLFVLFIFYIMIISVYSLSLVSFRAITCAQDKVIEAQLLNAKAKEEQKNSTLTISPAWGTNPAMRKAYQRMRRYRRDESMVNGVLSSLFDFQGCQLGVPAFFLVLEGLLFALFTCAMLCDQMTVLTTGVSQIDRLKGLKQTKRQPVNVVFGSASFQWEWLWPAPANFGENKQLVLGFRLRDDIAESA